MFRNEIIVLSECSNGKLSINQDIVLNMRREIKNVKEHAFLVAQFRPGLTISMYDNLLKSPRLLCLPGA